jgi:formiminotetrahydrofolate cyclodeaminase
MRLAEIATGTEQRRIEKQKSKADTAKQKAAYAKSVQAWFKMLKAEAEEKKSRQKFIQAAQAVSRSLRP